ncbi:MAG: BamA/TamA family outer membrane protein [candidate division KSB1 bacterium]|nr:BamA/TamA family outer membrane protein [candidate division KSB1 bacterium]MDZ7273920.1 BamA/TamA family outer membrane protein [candidate division KSB1 bacterium]MDZ7286076.1 BamA/TamA family outer membrane protein [candidate division KSB1 bacterium]MDZ7299108.1 BamA/TamA family outer membrane protein [candidate division KSB1 bacterium]MDZ7306655.1 BamA/TamA family outer membrane protein [candidate division KSB1 bacterium]
MTPGFSAFGGIFAFLLLILFPPLYSQTFGKNHVQYKSFQARYLQSRHFDIYFHAGGERLAEFTAEVAEQSYQALLADFRYELQDRITIVVYNSHNDFQQTNLNPGPPEEAVGGFTEFLKNRVVVPYEGDWEKFRHVIHHELTHAVMLQMVYGSGVQAILTGLGRIQMPLWFIEGLAEYESRGWDTESDLFMRDAALNGYVPAIHELSRHGFLAYKGGQSVFHYLAQRYGPKKISELLSRLKITKSLERAVRQSLGVEIEDLSKRWQQHLRRQYWPDIANRQEPQEIGTPLTDHLADRNVINNSAALSPKGDLVAFLSDKSDYFDIYLMSTLDGKIISKLVSGQKTDNLEELHWLRPGISWSPDGTQIVFAAKAGAQDALHLVDIHKRKIVRSLKFGLDGVFSPAWSPRGHEIAFVGLHNGQSDLYAVDLTSGQIRQITQDVFSDLEPSYSPDGARLAFVSDRGHHLDASRLEPDFKIWRSDYRNLDIYLVAMDDTAGGAHITRITHTPASEKSPVFSPQGDKLAFTSDRSGIYNIYLHDFATQKEYPITNVVSGIFQLSWAGAGSHLTFVSFFNGGYDVYLLKNPLDIQPETIRLEKTTFLTAWEGRHKRALPDSLPVPAHTDDATSRYRQYVFGKDFANGIVQPRPERVALADSTQYKTAEGKYLVRDYKTKFTPDIVYGNAGYNQFFGVQGQTQISLSDVLGNHRIDFITDLFYDLRHSNYLVRYFHLPRRTDYGIGAFHNAWYFYSTRSGLMRDRYYGLSVFASRPFSTFRRLEAGALWLGINREFLHQEGTPVRRLRLVIGSLAYVTDTALWGWTGPNNGSRSELAVSFSPKITGHNGLGFFTVRGDLRRYHKFFREYNFVLRLAGGLSEGSEPQQFHLGGLDNWLNQRFKGGLRIDRPEDIYFASFEMPLRGSDYYEKTGNRFVLVNLEFRYPLIRQLQLGWPLPLALANVRGTLFTDLGAAWHGKFGRHEAFQPFRRSPSLLPTLHDLQMGYGLGARSNLGFLLFRFDVAWKTNLNQASSKPRYYFSLGAEL